MALFSTNHTLTQGSLHYRLATLGYQKQNPYGVRLFANILCAAPPFERDEIKKAQRRWRCVPCYVLTQGSSLRSPTLGYQKQKAMGIVSLTNILCADLPFEIAIKNIPRWGSSPSQILQTSSAGASPLLGEGLGVRL